MKTIMDYIRAHGGEGIINASDVAELQSGEHRVLRLLSDGAWHTSEEICVAAGRNGTPAREGLRRMRDLRKKLGVTIEKRRLRNSRQFEYRMSYGF